MDTDNEKSVSTEKTEKTEQAENEHNTDVKADIEAEKPEQSAAPAEEKSEQSAAPEAEKQEEPAAPEAEKPEEPAAPEAEKQEEPAAPEAEKQEEPAAPEAEKQEEPAAPEAERTQAGEPVAEAQNESGRKKRKGFWGFAKCFLLLLLETLLLVALALYCVMYVLAKGPSPTAAKLFIRSVNETSAIGFLSRLYFSEEEIEEMIAPETMEYAETKTELINISTEPKSDEPQTDAWGFLDDDGDGIIIDDVKGEGYSGFMMIILDPSRVILATEPDNYGYKGYTVEEYVQNFGAVAGINGGAFADPNGQGNGSMPEGLVAFEGKYYLSGVKQGFAGIDADHILHVGCQSREDAEAANIQYGASYGPVLVQNGEMCEDGVLESGLNPRTAIGQRSDGAFLFLVIDGRQVSSLGASYLDEAQIMLSYGAVNAVNLDGGSSSLMWYGDSYVNNCASVIGIRPIPTAFVVLPKEG